MKIKTKDNKKIPVRIGYQHILKSGSGVHKDKKKEQKKKSCRKYKYTG